MKYVIEVNGRNYSVELPDKPDSVCPEYMAVKVDGRERVVRTLPGHTLDDGTFFIDDRPFDVEIRRKKDGLPEIVKIASHPYMVNVEEIGVARPMPKPRGRRETGEVFSAMSGMVVDIPVGEGQAVKKGQVILLLEAMKMENEIVAPFDGRIRRIAVKSGQNVLPRAILMELEIPES